MQRINILIKQLADLRKTRSGKFAIAGIISTIATLCCIFATLFLPDNSQDVEPTLDLVSVNLTAIYQAWLPFTQTAASIPTSTSTRVYRN